MLETQIIIFILLLFILAVILTIVFLTKKRLKKKGLAKIYESNGSYYWKYGSDTYNLISNKFKSIEEARRNLYNELRKRRII